MHDLRTSSSEELASAKREIESTRSELARVTEELGHLKAELSSLSSTVKSGGRAYVTSPADLPLTSNPIPQPLPSVVTQSLPLGLSQPCWNKLAFLYSPLSFTNVTGKLFVKFLLDKKVLNEDEEARLCSYFTLPATLRAVSAIRRRPRHEDPPDLSHVALSFSLQDGARVLDSTCLGAVNPESVFKWFLGLQSRTSLKPCLGTITKCLGDAALVRAIAGLQVANREAYSGIDWTGLSAKFEDLMRACGAGAGAGGSAGAGAGAGAGGSTGGGAGGGAGGSAGAGAGGSAGAGAGADADADVDADVGVETGSGAGAGAGAARTVADTQATSPVDQPSDLRDSSAAVPRSSNEGDTTIAATTLITSTRTKSPGRAASKRRRR